ASLLAELRWQPVRADRLEMVRKYLREDMSVRKHWYGDTFTPECLAHEQTPPLVLALARSELALGHGHESLKLLAGPAEAIQDSLTVEDAREEILINYRRLR